ncbi:MAG TPA: DUF86 domain-containing protein [Ktedonobacterales bacterium]|nr:DUF86 domain-containing protein [Ktedonobacterales bacterium]
MSDRDPRVMLREMVESIRAVRLYLQGVSKEEFINSALVQDAVIRRIEILGEAANQIPDAVKQRFPEVEWREISAMRNRLIHGYFSVNIEVVWNTAEHDLTPLEAHAQAMLSQLVQEAQGG